MSRVVSTWCLFLDNGDELSVQGVRTAKSLRAGTTKNLRARTSLYILPTTFHVLVTFSFGNF